MSKLNPLAPIDRAYGVSRCLAALDGLLATNNPLDIVKGDDLATLMHLLRTELDCALDALEQSSRKPTHLRGL